VSFGLLPKVLLVGSWKPTPELDCFDRILNELKGEELEKKKKKKKKKGEEGKEHERRKI
jgi:hypothetical protein